VTKSRLPNAAAPSVAALLLCAVSLLAQTVSNPPALPTQFKLANGLTVILHEDHAKPEVFGLVVVKVGSKHDPADATGLAHYQEHMLFKGTSEIGTTNWAEEQVALDRISALYDQLGRAKAAGERADLQRQINAESVRAGACAIPNELNRLLQRLGGTDINANTSWDRTLYFNTFPPNQLNRWLELYSHRFLEPAFRLFQAELEVVYEEKNLYLDSFQANLVEFFMKRFFKKHPYGQQPILGTVEHLKNPSLTKMKDFFRTYYVANNMALVLCGDFQAAAAQSAIQEKFSRWRSGVVPPFPAYAEAPFRGRELVTTRLSPIRLAALGFRTPKAGDPDEVPFAVCNGILANNNQNGLLDKLTLDHKLLAAQPIPMVLNDHGAASILAVPKIPFQTLGSAERLVLAELKKLGQGDFDASLLEAVKSQLYVSYCKQLEANAARGGLIGEAFAQNRALREVFSYPERVRAVTRDDVLRVARQYYSSNFLCLESRRGSLNNEKLAKPGYQPIPAKPDAQSAYAQKLEQMPAGQAAVRPLDFNQAVALLPLPGGNTLYCTHNPCNDVFSLRLKYGLGVWKQPRLKPAADLMNLAGTSRRAAYELKTAFSKLGCTCSISVDDSYTEVALEGIESNLVPALELLHELLADPRLDKEKLKVVVEAERALREVEKSEPDELAEAVFEYARRRSRSFYLRRLSLSEIKALTPALLVAEFKEALCHQCEAHYVGRLAPATVQAYLSRSLDLTRATRPSDSPISLDNESYGTNTIFFLHHKKALQSKIRWLVNTTPCRTVQEPCIDAFNQYWAGGFSGLLMQEVREYRSLAYNADAEYHIPRRPGVTAYLSGTVYTQADKTIETLEVLTNLLSNMPEKPGRMETVRSFLEATAQTEYPHFRALSEKIAAWKLRGYTNDPLSLKAESYRRLTFGDLVRFYQENVQARPMALAIVGDRERIDLQALARFGRVITVKEKDIFK
jgi:zinc protease